MVSIVIAKAESPSSRPFGNIDLTIRYKADASGVQQIGAIGDTQAQVACQAVTTAGVVAAQERLCLPGSACLSPSSRWARWPADRSYGDQGTLADPQKPGL